MKQLYHVTIQDPGIYCPKQFHHVATQYPGHGTKFVTLPSSYCVVSLIHVYCYRFYM